MKVTRIWADDQGTARFEETDEPTSMADYVPGRRSERTEGQSVRSPSDGAAGPKPLDLLRHVPAQIGEDGVRVRPESGSRLMCAPGADLVGARGLAQRPPLRMLDLDDHVARQYLGIFERLAHAVHGRTRHPAA